VTEPDRPDPDRPGLKPGHWVLIGIVALLVISAAFVVVRRDRRQNLEAGPTPAPTVASSSSAPACLPTVDEIGYSRPDTGSRVDFGLIVRNDCPVAAVNNVVDVAAIGTDGQPIKDPYAPHLNLPVILPGQRLGLGDFLQVDRSKQVARLAATISNTANLPAPEFATWARSATVTDLKHTGPDTHGLTTVTGTLVTDPSTVTLCNPQFSLILRDQNNKIIYGVRSLQNEPTFAERVPAATDWSKAAVYLLQGVFTLGAPSGARASCRAR
jgi:hypothetical protein